MWTLGSKGSELTVLYSLLRAKRVLLWFPIHRALMMLGLCFGLLSSPGKSWKYFSKKLYADKSYTGAWLVIPTYMAYVCGHEILESRSMASKAGSEGISPVHGRLTIKDE